jgi:N-carbamoyl-L-amino-acid hydrolase
MHTSLRINDQRFRNNFEKLSQIGATDGGGVHRPTFSPAHLQARVWFREQAKISGLSFHIDEAGNHSAILTCGPHGAPTLLLGSHLDSVPYGGRFDGAIGVLAALEVLQTVQDARLKLPYHLEAVDFTDEEGTLVGLLGSSAMAGILSKEDLLEPRGGRDKLLAGLKASGLNESGLLIAQRGSKSLVGYIELHIEQGPFLIECNKNIGVVTSIVGIGSYRLTYIGRANHAGTTSMLSRRDAAQGASAFSLGVRELVMTKFPECVTNIGNINLEPGGFNIIPGKAIVSFEFRAPQQDMLDQLETSCLDLAQQCASHFELGLEIEFLGKHNPSLMDEKLQASIERAAHTLGLNSVSLPSGAGHDAQSMVSICPAGMVFIPSIGGISHTASEFSEWQDCINGANMLLQTTLDWAKNFR